MSPRRTCIAVESRNALSGILARVKGGRVTRAKTLEKGSALSRANAHVAREAAHEIEIAQKIPIPKTVDPRHQLFRENTGELTD